MPDIGGISSGRLRSFVERVERIEEEIAALNADKSDIYKEAKGTGFDVPTIRLVIRRRRKHKDELDEADTLLDLYERAIGETGTSDATRVHVREAAE